jgi:REP-associated tyrosine transposase
MRKPTLAPMPRPLRVEVPGGTYHLTARGNRRQPIFRSDVDQELLLGLLARVVSALDWRVRSYCLMPNHFHLVVMIEHANLSRGMQQLNGRYAQLFNERYGLRGHLFQGRFHSTLIERDEHLLELTRYVVLNPVRAGLCVHPGEWRWSSYRAMTGCTRAPVFLAADWTLGLFGRTPTESKRAFATFVRDGIRPDPAT